MGVYQIDCKFSGATFSVMEFGLQWILRVSHFEENSLIHCGYMCSKMSHDARTGDVNKVYGTLAPAEPISCTYK